MADAASATAMVHGPWKSACLALPNQRSRGSSGNPCCREGAQGSAPCRAWSRRKCPPSNLPTVAVGAVQLRDRLGCRPCAGWTIRIVPTGRRAACLYLQRFSLRKCAWMSSFGYGLVAKQVGKFSGCSTQSLWRIPASSSFLDKLTSCVCPLTSSTTLCICARFPSAQYCFVCSSSRCSQVAATVAWQACATRLPICQPSSLDRAFRITT
mmetsp:Transcript_9497/g.57933  ORF Transcript_9497/g.57933 Transcript_9497/m.57933 type:complete len:210 (+) Transcript_9497:42-671(+)